MNSRRVVLGALVLGASLLALGLSGRSRPVVSQPPELADFANFESPPIHPICLSPNGQKLFALNVPDARLTVFTVTPQGLTKADEIPVGLEPVTVAARTDNEVWVVNHLSDDISIVDVAAGNVVKTLRVGDEPTDVVFARASTAPGAQELAFVCVSAEDAVKAYDAVTRAPVGSPIAVFGSDPRALALSADRTKVYAAAFASGNKTTLVPFQAVQANGGLPAPNPPKRADLPAAPNVGLIVQHDGTAWRDATGKSWSPQLPYSVADKDVFEIDAGTRTVTREITGVGTLLFNLALHPTTGQLWVTNTDALSLVRFEPNHRGRFERNRVSLVTPSTGAVTPVHLNPHINYAVTPGPAGEIAQSLAQPTDLRFLPNGTKAYVAALGSNKVGVLNGTTATVSNRIAVGQGPVGLAMSSAGDRLYVLNRFDNTISIVTTATDAVSSTVSLGFDPTPAVIKDGRPFLYDAALTSGHGDVSCASCHAFADRDHIAWDLGDPQGNYMNPPPGQIAGALLEGFHPMKGPMVTQTLRGLEGVGMLHWRADRANFNAFNGAFVSLLGRGDSLSASDMQKYTDFILTVRYGGNPRQNLNRTFPNPPVGTPSPERGRNEFTNIQHDGPFTCNLCHTVPTGTNNQIVNDDALLEDQDMKVPQLRNMAEKNFLSRAPGAVNKSGFGFTHDGAFDNLVHFLQLPVFNFPGGDAQRRDVEAFLFAFDTGTAPAVGYRITLDDGNRDLASTTGALDTLYDQAEAQNVDLVVKGLAGGVKRSWLYDRDTDSFESDRLSEPNVSKTALRALAGTGHALTWFAVAPGSGRRMGLDRDRDTFYDRDEVDAGSDPGNPASTPATVAVEPGTGSDGAGGHVALSGGTPNPFGRTASTTIAFEMPRPGIARVEVFDALGRRVRLVFDGPRPAGANTVVWDGRDGDGVEASSGVYFYRLSALGERVTAKGLRL